MEQVIRDPKDKRILFYFIAFFGLIFVVNGIFAYMAIHTQTGVVTEHAYEKGLDYNALLDQAKNQPKLREKVTYAPPVLRWKILSESGRFIDKATVRAKLVRPVQEGHDFDITLSYKGRGIYEAPLKLPFKGLWVAKLESQWTENKKAKTYKTTHQFIVK